MDFRGKTALITGASRGIGKAIAFSLAQQKISTLILVARDTRKLQKVSDALIQLGPNVTTIPLDLTAPRQVHRAIATVLQHHPPVDLLVNCAGIAHQRPFIESQLQQLEAELLTNLLGMYTVTRLVARQMVQRKQGHIVNVSSLMGKVAAPSMATYSATKYAIVGFTQALRSELAPHNVQVTNLMPSLTKTDMVRGFSQFRWVQTAQPEQVARAMLAGVRRGNREILVGWQSHAAVLCERLAPQLMVQLIRWSQPQPLSKPKTPPIPALIQPQLSTPNPHSNSVKATGPNKY